MCCVSQDIKMSEDKKVACFDFDGVIHRYVGYGTGELGSPLRAGIDILARFFAHDYEILIHTCRLNRKHANWQEQKDAIENWLDYYNVPFTKVVTDRDGKPIADVYFDDRAIPVPKNYRDIAKHPFYSQFKGQKDEDIDVADAIYKAGLEIAEKSYKDDLL